MKHKNISKKLPLTTLHTGNKNATCWKQRAESWEKFCSKVEKHLFFNQPVKRHMDIFSGLQLIIKNYAGKKKIQTGKQVTAIATQTELNWAEWQDHTTSTLITTCCKKRVGVLFLIGLTHTN